MSIVEWSDELSVGVDALDHDHRRLIAFLHEMDNALAAGRADDVLEDIIHGLLDYTHVHFVHEEALMAEAGYTGLDAHKEQHRKLAAEVHSFAKEFRIDPRPFIAGELIAFLNDWLVLHIAEEDQQYRPALATLRHAGNASTRWSPLVIPEFC